MAGGCGDWDHLAATWDLNRYEAMARHWQEVAPPTHLSLAAYVGFKPRQRQAEAVDTMSEEQFDAELREMERFFRGN